MKVLHWGKNIQMVHLSRSHCRCQDNTLDGPLFCFIVKFEYFEFTGWELIQNSQYDTYMYDETRLAEPVKILPSLHPSIHYAGTNIALLTSIGQSLQYFFFISPKAKN